MKRVFTKTFFRFLLSFMAILAISCSVLVITSAEARGSAAAAIESVFGAN